MSNSIYSKHWIGQNWSLHPLFHIQHKQVFESVRFQTCEKLTESIRFRFEVHHIANGKQCSKPATSRSLTQRPFHRATQKRKCSLSQNHTTCCCCCCYIPSRCTRRQALLDRSFLCRHVQIMNWISSTLWLGVWDRTAICWNQLHIHMYISK